MDLICNVFGLNYKRSIKMAGFNASRSSVPFLPEKRENDITWFWSHETGFLVDLWTDKASHRGGRRILGEVTNKKLGGPLGRAYL